ncbi:conserved hypothetical protein [Listeria ivanovii FSL F6-596]|nr:conserved hypothetical protein [Listeria ivanovii FSL F6-596]
MFPKKICKTDLKWQKKRTINFAYKSMFVNALTILVANGTMYSGK